jgi:phage terminase large subunit GpA-like protein
MTLRAPEHIKKLFPQSVQASCEGLYRFDLPAAVRSTIKRRPLIDCCEWTHRHRRLRDDTHNAVPWSKDSTPYLDGLMFAVSQPWVQDVVFVGCPQSGKSEFGHNVVGWSTEHHAGPVLYVYPDELTSKENSTERVLPMFKDSPALRRHMTGHDDDETTNLIRLKHLNIYFGWSSSVRRLANKAIKILILDEEAKFDESAGSKEGNSSLLALKRLTKFGDRYKCVRTSTCTVESCTIWVAYLESLYHFEYHARCPDCDTLQAMDFVAQSTFIFPEGDTAQEIREAQSARYVCRCCGEQWNDYKRDVAVRAGEWICSAPPGVENFSSEAIGENLHTVVMTRKPRKIAARLPSWYSAFVSLSEVVANYIQSEESGKQKDKQVFRNQDEALPYENIAQDRQIEFMQRLRRPDMPKGVAPNGTVLVMTVDTQQSFFWFEVRAFDPETGLRGHCLDAGRLVSFEDIERHWGEAVYVNVSGEIVRPRIGLIDSGGTRKEGEEHSRTRQVYQFCRQNPQFIPYKGRPQQIAPWRISNIDFWPGTNEQIPGGLQLFICDTSFYKDDLAARISNDPESESAWTFYSEYPDEYLKHYTAEYRDDNGKWAHNKKIRNDLWDCGHMSLSAADILKIADLGKIKKRPPKTIKPKHRKKPKQSASKSMW